VTFAVSSRLQGVQTVEAHIFLWRADAKVVISDIDGTITKSDFLGNVMPLVGRDWSHDGVAGLFASIASNGYHFMYLTSRAIGQVRMRDAFSIRADESLNEG
jgi:phosphatidate phosphatase LPIN